MEHIKDVLEKVPEVPEDIVEQPDGTWGFGAVWNAGLLVREERERKPRDYVWASELDKSNVDIWLSMKGTEPSNRPNARSLRKFVAGDIWEWILMLMLLKAGILVETQERVEHQYEGLIKVTGKLDFDAGGKPDFEKGRKELEALMLPPQMKNIGANILRFLEEKYPDGLEQKIIEAKSRSVFMFEKDMKTKRGQKAHRMQLTHYLVGKNRRAGELFYICRDDCRLLEVPVLNPGANVDEYKKRIQELTVVAAMTEQPAIEPLVLFDEDEGKFSKNWRIEYSSYLTMLYGYERPDLYADEVKPMVARWNRVMGRVKKGEKMTPGNLEAIEEMKRWSFDPDALVDKFAGGDKEETETV